MNLSAVLPFRASAPRRYRLGDAQQRAALVLVAPAMLHFLIFTSLPVFAVVFLSFTDYSALELPKFLGLRNYEQILQDEVFWQAVKNTFQYVLAVVPATLVLGLATALLLNRALWGRTLYRTAFYIPTVTSTAAISMVWLWMYNSRFGLVNFLLERIGIPGQAWLSKPELALWAIILMSIWRGTGANMIIFLAGLQSVPRILYEAAAIDGADRWKLFWNVTLPMLTPTTFFVLVTSVISSFQVYEQVYMMTRGGPGYASTTIVHQIYQQAFENYRLGYASTLGVFLFLIILVVTLINNRFFKAEIEYN